ncbi:MAG: glycosyltransferase [Bacteroidetes bacterium]|nr:MAG: glycosyltransferase [Bacteroidota bacterium]
MEHKKTILVCPMDWGLGHATRMVPVIEALKKKKNIRIILGADNRPLEFLKQRYPELEMIKFPGYAPRYPVKGAMVLKMLSEMPEMKKQADKAHLFLETLIDEMKIDLVISDNRYELWSDKAKTVFITHQLNVQTPRYGGVAKPALRQMIYSYIKKYDELWIPDVAGDNNLSGALSHISNFPLTNYHFIGPLTRFQYVKPQLPEQNIDLLILLSGPEPQRTILEIKLKDQAFQSGLNTVILQGRTEESHQIKMGNVETFSHLPDNQFSGMILKAKTIICRPGYSSLMDLAWFGKRAVFIPTPGQTEQEFLAESLKQKGLYYYQNQKEFNLQKALLQSENYYGLKMQNNGQLLEERIAALIENKE